MLKEVEEEMKPQRIQRKRTKGWKLPKNTICVDRTSKWGNPYKIGDNVDGILNLSREQVVRRFEEDAIHNFVFIAHVRAELKGKNLACFCPLHLPCHSDVLLKIANL